MAYRYYFLSFPVRISEDTCDKKVVKSKWLDKDKSMRIQLNANSVILTLVLSNASRRVAGKFASIQEKISIYTVKACRKIIFLNFIWCVE